MKRLIVFFSICTSYTIGFAQNIAVNTSGTAAASTNMFEVTQTGAAANMVAIYAINSGATAGTGYALYSTKTGAGTANVAGYFSATGGTANYAGIFENGNVGIGTTTPRVSLEVASTVATNLGGWFRSSSTSTTHGNLPVLLIQNTNNTNNNGAGIRFIDSGTNAVKQIGTVFTNHTGAGRFFISNGTTEQVVVDNAGDVGIGTTAPRCLLQTTGSGDQELRVAHNDNVVGRTVTLKLTNDYAAYNNDGVWVQAIEGTGVDDYDMGLFTTTSTALTASEKMRIKDNGNIGIGTTAPSCKLDVLGNGFFGPHSNAATDGFLQVSSGSSANNARINFGFWAGFDAIIWNIGRWGTDGSFRISDFSSGAESNKMTFLTSGFTGMGTTVPATYLHVKGQNVNNRGQLSLEATDYAQFTLYGGATTGTNLGTQFYFDVVNGRTVLQGYNGTNTTASTVAINPGGGNVGIGTSVPTSKLQVVGLPVYANNAAALTGGLTAGAFYRTGGDPDVVCVVH